MTKEITTKQELIISGPTMLVFYADWCGPCKAYKHNYDRLSRNNEKVTIYRVNTDTSPELAQEYGVRSIPLSVFFIDGKETKETGMLGYSQLNNIFNKS